MSEVPTGGEPTSKRTDGIGRDPPGKWVATPIRLGRRGSNTIWSSAAPTILGLAP